MSFVSNRDGNEFKVERGHVYFPSFHQVPCRNHFTRHSTWKLRRSLALFLRFIENSSICEFLQNDEDFRSADKFLLAMVFIYFSRAKLREEHWTKESFYIALWLAHDSVEEDLTAKYALLPWAFPIDDQRATGEIKNDFKEFLTKKNDLWTRMNFRARVTKDQCEAIFAVEPNLWIWRRERPDDYQQKLAAVHREKFLPEDSICSNSSPIDEDHC